jgi:hypothetical protein
MMLSRRVEQDALHHNKETIPLQYAQLETLETSDP